jgi:hypothetical protein
VNLARTTVPDKDKVYYLVTQSSVLLQQCFQPRHSHFMKETYSASYFAFVVWFKFLV